MKKMFLLIALIGLMYCVAAYGQVPASGQSSGSFGKMNVGKTTLGTLDVQSIPNKLSYQGLLTTSSGAPAQDGNYDLKFELFNVSAGGSGLWTETQTGVGVQRGTFSVLLGSVTPLTALFDQPLWVEITAMAGPGISSPIVFSPRTELASSPYALGPLLKTTDGYYLSSPRFGLSGPPIGDFVGLDVFSPNHSVRTKMTGPAYSTGFWADKYDQSANNYFVLQTGGADRWSLGTIGNDNFSLYNWAYGRYDLYATMDGLVGIGTNSPTKKLDVNGAVQVKDSLFVGSPTQNGIVNIYRNGSTEPIVKTEDYSSMGGQITLQDELGNPIAYMRPNGYGEGGGIKLYSNTSQMGFEAWGNAYGLGEGYAAVYGNNRSMIFTTRFAGDASVQLPDSSISSAEMLDEPGIAVEFGSYSFLIPATGTKYPVDSVTINVPAAGKVVVDACGYIIVNHATGTSDNVAVHVFTDPNPVNMYVNGVSNLYISTALPTAEFRNPFACQNIFNVSSATALKIYLVGYRNSGGSAYVMNSLIKATYYPTTYGSTPVAVISFNNNQDGAMQAQGTPENIVTYQTAEEFNSAKSQQYRAELEQLTAKIKTLENQLGNNPGGSPDKR